MNTVIAMKAEGERPVAGRRECKPAAGLVFLFLVFCLSASCIPWPWGLQSEDVRVIVEPFGDGDEIRPGVPLLRFNAPTLPTCRPAPLTDRSLRAIFSNIGFDVNQEGGIGDILGLREPGAAGGGATGAGPADEEERERQRLPVIVQGIGNGWVKFGLYISNGRNFSNSANRKEHLLLVITDLFVTASARVGERVETFAGNVGSDYCASEGQLRLDFLYLVPGGKAVKYRPDSNNPLENLTIYLSGFPVIDNRQQAEAVPGAEDGAGGGAGAAAAGNNSLVGNCIIYVPRYRVRLTLSGYFMTSSGTKVQNFNHRTVFHTTSLNDC